MNARFFSLATMLGAAVVLSLGATASVSAADLPAKAPVYKAAPPAVINWTGFYIGIDGGWGNARYGHNFNTAGHYNNNLGNTFN
jgi:outer membrane immunogenic protein